MKQAWTTDIKDWQSLDPASASLLIELAQQRLAATIDSANIITSTRDRYITINTAVITAAISYAVAGNNDSLTLASSMTIALCMLTYVFLYRNLNAYSIYPLGREPKNVFIEKLVGPYQGQHQYLAIVFAVLESIQLKIDHNTVVNGQRVRNNKWAQRSIACVPLIILLAHAIVKTFDPL